MAGNGTEASLDPSVVEVVGAVVLVVEGAEEDPAVSGSENGREYYARDESGSILQKDSS